MLAQIDFENKKDGRGCPDASALTPGCPYSSVWMDALCPAPESVFPPRGFNSQDLASVQPSIERTLSTPGVTVRFMLLSGSSNQLSFSKPFLKSFVVEEGKYCVQSDASLGNCFNYTGVV